MYVVCGLERRTEMEIEEVKKEKDYMESEIAKVIRDFESKTGTKVTDIDFKRIQDMPFRDMLIIKTTVVI